MTVVLLTTDLLLFLLTLTVPCHETGAAMLLQPVPPSSSHSRAAGQIRARLVTQLLSTPSLATAAASRRQVRRLSVIIMRCSLSRPAFI
ncbi:unnamed protein product [Soboliphyme baturini]|uniref:Secreted protein n=1 Tax=Soboliphyme baturini TaxID=241478 RepID=A0A183J8A4_9BILA|nr:unnamed protein product [Soboliphyme baturini]